jgi:hypothetical protein
MQVAWRDTGTWISTGRIPVVKLRSVSSWWIAKPHGDVGAASSIRRGHAGSPAERQRDDERRPTSKVECRLVFWWSILCGLPRKLAGYEFVEGARQSCFRADQRRIGKCQTLKASEKV